MSEMENDLIVSINTMSHKDTSMNENRDMGGEGPLHELQPDVMKIEELLEQDLVSKSPEEQ